MGLERSVAEGTRGRERESERARERESERARERESERARKRETPKRDAALGWKACRFGGVNSMCEFDVAGRTLGANERAHLIDRRLHRHRRLVVQDGARISGRRAAALSQRLLKLGPMGVDVEGEAGQLPAANNREGPRHQQEARALRPRQCEAAHVGWAASTTRHHHRSCAEQLT